MPFINQIEKMNTLFLRLLFLLSSLLEESLKVNMLIVNQISELKCQFSRF